MTRDYDENCVGCPYHKDGSLHVHPPTRASYPLEKTNNGAEVLLVLQSPGEVEWKVCLPLQNFENGAGLRFKKSFDRIGKDRTGYDITNSVQCYQGKGANGRDKKPSTKAQERCRNKLKMDIEEKMYRKIIVFGAVAREQVKSLGFTSGKDPRFVFLTHPSGGLTNTDLDAALNT